MGYSTCQDLIPKFAFPQHLEVTTESTECREPAVRQATFEPKSVVPRVRHHGVRGVAGTKEKKKKPDSPHLSDRNTSIARNAYTTLHAQNGTRAYS